MQTGYTLPVLRRLSKSLFTLSALVSMGGLLALGLQIRETESWRPHLEAFMGDAWSNTAVWLAAAAWLAFGLTARFLGGLEPSRRGLARPEPDEKPMASRDESPTGISTRRGSVERLRLEALMRGERPETASFLDQAVALASEAGASDIHLQPVGKEALVTFRTRGELREVARYPARHHADVVRRAKVLAELPPYVTAAPQDGRFSLETANGKVDIRLSTVPAQDGERLALRLAGDAEARSLSELGLLPRERERFERLLTEPQGLIVLTGPTGCGKTTTLYGALQHIHRHRGTSTSIASIEDPVEIDLPFIHQVPVDRARNMTFASALRSVLRQDPNVLMVGEIRDAETAKTAIQAGLSGHLILTTLHADSTLGVFPRLIDLGTEPFLAASATLACLSQRLAGRLCPHCRHPRQMKAEEREALEALDLPKNLLDAEYFTAEGCAECERKGLDGRVAVFELLVLDTELRRRITTKASRDELEEAARAAGSIFFQESALELAATGEISLDEARRFFAGAQRS